MNNTSWPHATTHTETPAAVAAIHQDGSARHFSATWAIICAVRPVEPSSTAITSEVGLR